MPNRRSSSIRLRRAAVLVVSLVLPVSLVAWGGHRGVHMARNLLFPGAGVIDHSLWLAALFAVLAIAATVLWLQWGAGWSVIAVVVVSTIVSGLVAGTHPGPAASAHRLLPIRAAHEFPLVVLVVTALAWLRSVLGRVPGISHLAKRRNRSRTGVGDLDALPPVERCRAAAVLLLIDAGDTAAAAVAHSRGIRRRARLVNAVSRFRFGRDPFGPDHAYARTVRVLSGEATADEVGRFANEADRTAIGLPCSEPSWVRPLDATLAALALRQRGEGRVADAWTEALHGGFALRRGHRPAWWWTPMDLGAGSAPPWEHAAFTGIARAAGWIGDDDWASLRQRALGAAARGADNPHDERMVAAARLWLASVHDPEAHRIVMRPGVRRDPLACAFDQLAARLCDNPWLLRPGAATAPPGGDQT